MDSKTLFENIAQALISGWEIDTTGNGFLVLTDWRLPNNDRIEIFIRTVGEREDLYLVTDGGNLFNFLFSHGIDLNKDKASLKALNSIAENHAVQFVEYQLARGANEKDIHTAVRALLEAIKDTAFFLWHKLEGQGSPIH